jgi:hypothetical protein
MLNRRKSCYGGKMATWCACTGSRAASVFVVVCAEIGMPRILINSVPCS